MKSKEGKRISKRKDVAKGLHINGETNRLNGLRYSGMDQVKFAEDSL